MKKIILSTTLIFFIAFYYFEFEDYYKNGTINKINIKVGQELNIKILENASTGFVNCWLNEEKNLILIKVKEDFIPGLNSRLGYIGSGGIKKITFKGIKIGIDTVKIARCSFIDYKKCSDYNEKNTESDYQFIIKVTN